ncbi:hypothetical protein AJ80_03900 [Polytolypa hystricis UAMH7299]|uniref:Elongator complex protein 4 n=1 Tax=Polytolypa hystricis (strain UAMH7299) TaxID=1447883 RepID=A0A2B7Y5X7_POLH7|nr:hypothetical protein AJ80_03900 [Polytolypa hystricis UAMH7299]
MSFRKRNIGLSSGTARGITPNAVGPTPAQPSAQPPSQPILGLRPSPVDGRQTTSTGTLTLDNLLAGHAGLVLGCSLVIEESGTTDFAGALLRYYAAEGVVQEHQLHVIGAGELWGKALPGLIEGGEAGEVKRREAKGEKMKIAWRYERLGEFGAGVAGSRGSGPASDKSAVTSATGAGTAPPVFCHTFDLTKRLVHPAISSINFIPLAPSNGSPYTSALNRLSNAISSSPPNSIHRVIIPSLLSPALYPPNASSPEHLLQFLHSIRALLSKYSSRMTAMITLPLSLYPRSSGLTRWIELLSDGVLELAPFPHLSDASPTATSGAATTQEEPPQGMLKVHRLPVLHERGGGGDNNVGEDWAFTLSRRKFTIKPFSLPPLEGDHEAQQGNTSAGPSKADLEF